ncbi:hypothetical protein G6F65_019754 [Rhizopus arrhizus]|nr:hypothetical protein G6F65_019754 [Rhizopus arrhizus]
MATIGKTEQALKDIPQSVTVVTRKRLDDQNLSTISEVLENTTGVTISEVADGGRNFYSRGFKITNIQYDGVPLSRSFYAVGNSFTGSTAYLDRVEVFRGAQGLFEGAGQPGGSVNLVRKRPTAETQVLMEARAGSWDHPAGAGGAGSGFQGFVHRRGEGAQHQSVLRAGFRPGAQHDGGRGRAGVAPAVHAVLRRAAAL